METVGESALAGATIQLRTNRSARCGVTSGGGSPEPAHVDRIECHIRPYGRVDRGAELRLVVDAGLLHTCGEIDQGLLLRIGTQLARRVLKSRQFSIRVKYVELGLVGDQ